MIDPARLDLVQVAYSYDLVTGRLQAKGDVSPFVSGVDLDTKVGEVCPCSECMGSLVKHLVTVEGLGRVGAK